MLTAEIRVGTGTHTGPGTASSIDNTAAATQGIDILGGFASNCFDRTDDPIDPTNTIIEAPMPGGMGDRVFLINNTTANLSGGNIQGLTITGGDPTAACAASGKTGGGVCLTSNRVMVG